MRQLSAKKLKPSKTADKATLLRRVYFDLIGLPPTPDQLAEYLNDNSSQAYENVVDKLLESPHYGEQMAASWLDAARYADTNGYQNDFVRTMWPWRDWVINAFNQNLPYDDFIVQQIAGDMLPSPMKDQLIATGFSRNNRSVTEGGAIEAEWRVENCVDRVEAVSAAFLGLTLGCARCHDHKYDPVSHKEFYEFFAFFNNVDEKGFYQEARGNVGPTVTVNSPQQERELKKLTAQIKTLNSKIQAATLGPNELEQRMTQWNVGDQDGKLPKSVFQFTGTDAKPDQIGSPVGFSAEFEGLANAVKVKPPSYQFGTNAPFSWSVWLHGNSRGAIFGQMDETMNYRGVDGLLLSDGKLKIHLIHQWNSNAIAVISKRPLPASTWVFVTVTYDGKGKAEGVKLYFDGKPMPVDIEADSLTETLTTKVPFKIGQRSSSEFLKGSLADFRLYDRELSDKEVGQLLRQSLVQRYTFVSHTDRANSDESKSSLEAAAGYLIRLDHFEESQKLANLQSQYDKLSKSPTTTMVMRDRADYRETFLFETRPVRLAPTKS